jgi:hypothetical protein
MSNDTQVIADACTVIATDAKTVAAVRTHTMTP